MADSENPIRPGSNYQFNFYSLFAYHNLGLIKNSSLIKKADILYNTDIPEEEEPEVPSGPETPPEEENQTPKYHINHSEDVLKIYEALKTKDKNGDYTITVEFETGRQLYYSCFNPPEGTVFMFTGRTEAFGKQTLSFNVTAEQAEGIDEITMMFYDDEARSFAFFKM